jgi:hypothetical protein
VQTKKQKRTSMRNKCQANHVSWLFPMERLVVVSGGSRQFPLSINNDVVKERRASRILEEVVESDESSILVLQVGHCQQYWH